MNKKSAYSLSFLALLLLAGGIFTTLPLERPVERARHGERMDARLAEEPMSFTAPEGQATALAESSANHSTEEVGIEPPRTDASSPDNVDDAHDAQQARIIIEKAEAAGLPVAKDWNYRLNIYCDQNELEDLVAKPRSDLSEVEESRVQYCDGAWGSTGIAEMDYYQAREFYDQLLETQVENLLLSELSDSNIEERSDIIEDFLAQTEHYEQVQGLINLIQSTYHPNRTLIWDSPGPEFAHLPVDGAKIQVAALVLYGCARFGGCGSNSLRVRDACLSVACEPWWGMQDMLYANLTPREYQLAHEILINLK